MRRGNVRLARCVTCINIGTRPSCALRTSSETCINGEVCTAWALCASSETCINGDEACTAWALCASSAAECARWKGRKVQLVRGPPVMRCVVAAEGVSVAAHTARELCGKWLCAQQAAVSETCANSDERWLV
ncbi:hypothetical protein CYMTET_21991 [Cymbomonas tetramitiformis]|uniref:Uncharacterized protein n=1 Tax=Cymbomonas tetramitiformis TaxID=36881 RepID=A0AAE0G0U6_9CHLO|nr:hypothetical protein CYMTET_21991 [Cymbomonas tetramitiformis]